MTKPFRGTINNWREVNAGFGLGTIIVGEPMLDNRFSNYRDMSTSLIVSINKERNQVETLNSIYALTNEIKREKR